MTAVPGGLTLRVDLPPAVAQAELDATAAALHALFAAREGEFGFRPDVVVEHPDVAALLGDPAGYVEARIAALEPHGPIAGVTLLTTFGDRLDAPLAVAGWHATPIDMPAGPDFTRWYEQRRRPAGRTLYLEAVDEGDPKIRPGFALRLLDAAGRLRGGACGSLHAGCAYVATMTVDLGLPPGTGRALGAALLEVFRREGIRAAHLGTQTAGPFYAGLGFRVVHTVLPGLRTRRTADGSLRPSDLVMMEWTP